MKTEPCLSSPIKYYTIATGTNLVVASEMKQKIQLQGGKGVHSQVKAMVTLQGNAGGACTALAAQGGPLALQAVNLPLLTHTKSTLVFKEVALLILFTSPPAIPRPLQATGKEKETHTYTDRQQNSGSTLVVSNKYQNR